jgi:hypothetical protein
MLIDLYRKAHNEMAKWLEITAAAIRPVQQPVKIRISDVDRFKHHGDQRKISTLKGRY